MNRGSRFVIGIDLGTTNSTLSSIDTESGPEIKTFDIPQLVEAGEIKSLPALPSFLYLPGEYELAPGSTALPWDKDRNYITGEFAKIQGTRVPSNLVFSAKSWLCYNRVDREGPILPWGKETPVKRVSPVEASARYLLHMKEAWNYLLAGQKKENFFEEQQVVITIPASFDETARELTAEAARKAGIENFTMLEEPQAAFYAWLSRNADNWQELIRERRLILVLDVGGGTTDFTLIFADEKEGKPYLRRVAVGDHLMLGGDNMDLTLARLMEKKLLPAGKFDMMQWLSAVYQCRTAKEELLGDSARNSFTITVLGRGKGIVGGTLEGELSRDEVEETVLNGFFGKVSVSDEVRKTVVSGLQELGLPFVSDTEVMRHLSSFLKRHSANAELPMVKEKGIEIVRPDVLLFNGGVFRARAIRERAAGLLREWFSDGHWTLDILENEKYDQAVSIGAAYYGLVLRGKGERISGGAGRAYYIGVEMQTEAEQREVKDTVTVVCILARGMEAGEEIKLHDPEFQALTNSPVSFAVFSSSYRAGDRPGDIITTRRDEFIELPPVKTVLHFGKKAGAARIPVSLGIKLNEFGTLDVWCESRKTPHRWKLAFQLRMQAELEKAKPHPTRRDLHTIEESALSDAVEIMDRAFRGGDKDITMENVIKKMAEAIGLGKNSWPFFAIRKIWDRLITLKDRRSALPAIEARWLNLSGFLLRPGFGYQLDDWRMKELWKIFDAGPAFPNDAQCRLEWWIQWRRVAAGLDDTNQNVIFRKIAPRLLPSKKRAGLKKVSDAELHELWMLAASLEQLSSDTKIELGNELMRTKKKWKGKSATHYYWALSRLGARVPFHGPVERTVPREAAEQWIRGLLDMQWEHPKDTVYALTQLARKTGDRVRDIDEELGNRIVEKLSGYDWAERSSRRITNVIPLEWEDEREIFGESLPTGLSIAA